MAVRESLVKQVEEPTWEIAKLFPNQGEWSEADYLTLNTNRLIEFSNGHVEVLDMPTPSHQFLALYLYEMLVAFAREHQLGKVLVAPVPVRLWPRKFREPDLVFIFAEKVLQQDKRYWENVDLVMEVVSPDDPSRDYEKKRQDYADGGIAEYWIVDPVKQVVTVLTLKGETYTEHGVFTPGTAATSALLTGFAVDVTEIFAAAK